MMCVVDDVCCECVLWVCADGEVCKCCVSECNVVCLLGYKVYACVFVCVNLPILTHSTHITPHIYTHLQQNGCKPNSQASCILWNTTGLSTLYHSLTHSTHTLHHTFVLTFNNTDANKPNSQASCTIWNTTGLSTLPHPLTLPHKLHHTHPLYILSTHYITHYTPLHSTTLHSTPLTLNKIDANKPNSQASCTLWNTNRLCSRSC